MTRRALVYHHYDQDDIIDDYVIHFLQSAKLFGCDLLFGSNSALTKEELNQKIRPLTNDITLRTNRGFDFASWSQMLLRHGRDFFDSYDEVIIANSTVYGPLFPLDEVFSRMADVRCDFWTPTKHSSAYGIPEHVQPYFLVVRKALLQSDAFWNYWSSIKEDYVDLWDVIWNAEIRMTRDFVEAGFTFAVLAEPATYQELRDLGHYEPYVLHAVPYLIEAKRLPFVKVKAFYVNPQRPFTMSQFIFRALEWTGSSYPHGLIISHQKRVSPLSWHKNLPETLLIPDGSPEDPPPTPLKIGLFAHLFYPQKLDFFVRYLKNIPFPFDLNVTTPSEEIKRSLTKSISSAETNLAGLDIRIVKNRGRDIGPWIVEFRDKHFDYDLALKLQVKEHSQQPDVLGHVWNRYLFDCVLGSPQSVGSVVRAFEQDEKLGLVFPTYPPFYNMMFPHGYTGSSEDQHFRDLTFTRLAIKPVAETAQPIFSAGGIQWYRPKALSRLFESDVTIADFPREPFPTSSTFGHGLERAIPYIAQASGYSYKLCIPLKVLRDSFQMYEDRVMAYYQRETPAAPHEHPKVKQSFRILVRAIHRSYSSRFPGLARRTHWLAARMSRWLFSS